MGGPIVRTGTNPEFWANWEKAFGKKSTKKSTKKKSAKSSAKKKTAKKK